MSESDHANSAKWFAAVITASAAALLLAWLGRLAGMSLSALLTIGVGGVGLAWLITLVTVPWNLYFAARRVVAEAAESRARGIDVPAARDSEAGRIARRMLLFAVGGHVTSAAIVVVVAFYDGVSAGYYLAAAYLLSTGLRPAAAYLGHLRERIRLMSQENRYPREDVTWLRLQVETLTTNLKDSHAELRQAQVSLTHDLAHTRQLLTADLARLREAQEAEQAAGRSRDEALGRRIDKIVHRIEDTLDGISDHQELLTGIRALARVIRSDTA